MNDPFCIPRLPLPPVLKRLDGPRQPAERPGPCADDNTKVRRLDRRAQAAACVARRRWRTKTTHTRWPLGATVRPVDVAASCVMLLAELRSRLAGVGPRYAALRSLAEDLAACGVLRDLADLAAQVDETARADLAAIEGGA